MSIVIIFSRKNSRTITFIEFGFLTLCPDFTLAELVSLFGSCKATPQIFTTHSIGHSLNSTSKLFFFRNTPQGPFFITSKIEIFRIYVKTRVNHVHLRNTWYKLISLLPKFKNLKNLFCSQNFPLSKIMHKTQNHKSVISLHKIFIS